MFFYSKCAASFLPFLFEMRHVSICFAPLQIVERAFQVWRFHRAHACLLLAVVLFSGQVYVALAYAAK
jgi:hypothetical protein